MRWLLVSLGSPLLKNAPMGILSAHRRRGTAIRRAWNMKDLAGYMQFGVVDDRDGNVVWTTDGSHLLRADRQFLSRD